MTWNIWAGKGKGRSTSALRLSAIETDGRHLGVSRRDFLAVARDEALGFRQDFHQLREVLVRQARLELLDLVVWRDAARGGLRGDRGAVQQTNHTRKTKNAETITHMCLCKKRIGKILSTCSQ